MDKKILGVAVASVCIGVLLGAFIMLQFAPNILSLAGFIGVDFETWSIDSRVMIWKGAKLVMDEYNAGAVTNIGDNATLMWIFGDADYNVTEYLYNATYISIGDQGSLSTSSVVLPGEWNRTIGTVEDESQSWLNITCTFYPDSGPYTADCIGLNWRTGIGNSGNLWAYDTFTEVTGIDDTFTINVEFKISVAHS